MCRCCQTCLEDCYWSCIEEKFCYDESIAHFDADDDEYEPTKSANNLVANLENNNSPICEQPRAMQNTLRTVSSKCHQDELRREIQTTVPILAPEILAVFANSKIFHDDAPLTKTPMLAAVHKSGASKTASVKIVDSETDQLLNRLEGKDTRPTSEIGSYASLPKTRIRIITDEEADAEATVITRSASNPKFNDSAKNKRILQLQPPYFSARPASENDIFTIASEYGRISTTPEVPSVSFANLPKNYLETPTLEQYRESLSLYDIQSSDAMKKEVQDYTMPRYYRKSKLILPTPAEPADTIVTTPKNMTVSKRLQAIRTNLPPLRILSKEKVNEAHLVPVHHM